MERAARARPPPRLAAIDIGSNSIRLVVAEVSPSGAYRVLDEERDMARLGQGLAETGRLGRRPMRAALAALGKMKAIADGFKARLRAVATSAVRDASNGRAFRAEARRRIGVRVEIISGRDEGLLAFRSAARQFDIGRKSVAVADIGGGSLEVVLADGGVVHGAHSLPLGTVRLTERFSRSDPLRPRHWKSLRREIDRALKKQLGKPPFPLDLLIGSGGTFTNIAQIVKCAREKVRQPGSVHGFVLAPKDISRVLAKLRRMPLAARRRILGLNPKRADIIVAGAAAVARLAKRLNARKVVVNERGIRDGILLSMIAERRRRGEAGSGLSFLKSRLAGVRALSRKWGSSARHCEQVARLAGRIFDGLEAELGLPRPAREILQAAALLHDVGSSISHAERHLHAYHLILHSGLPGYSAREMELIANVARYNEGRYPRKSDPNLALLGRLDRRLVRLLSGILRVAESLDRTNSQRVSDLDFRVRGGRITMTLEARASPAVEIREAERRVRLFEKALQAEVTFTWRPKSRRSGRRSGTQMAPAGKASSRRTARGRR